MLPIPPASVAEAGLRTLKTIAMRDNAFHPLERDLLTSLQKHILKSEFDIDLLEQITPEEVVTAVPEEGGFRERIVNGCVMMTLIDGEAEEGELELVKEFAAALGVEGSLSVLQRYASGSLKFLRFDLLRRFIVRDRLKKEFSETGIRGLLKLARTAIMGGDKQLAARYQALEELPRGTLGREYFEFIRGNEFSLPGEPGSPPEIMVFHDCNHVLGEYGTTPEEESQIAAFHAGYRGQDQFGLMLFLLMQFHLGVQITPAAPGFEGLVNPDLVFGAFSRGQQVNRDLIADWDPRDDFERSVDELRKEFNIVPRNN